MLLAIKLTIHSCIEIKKGEPKKITKEFFMGSTLNLKTQKSKNKNRKAAKPHKKSGKPDLKYTPP